MTKQQESIIRVHRRVILGICIPFGVLQVVFYHNLPAGLGMWIGSVIVIALKFYFEKQKTPYGIVGGFLTLFQLALIILTVCLKHNVYEHFALLVASMAIGAVYNNMNILYIHWAIVNVVCIYAAFNPDLLLGTIVGKDILINGLLGINVGSFLITYLVKNNVKNIQIAEQANKDTQNLLEQVNVEMGKAEEMAETQKNIVHQVAETSGSVTSHINEMSSLASQIDASAHGQRDSIADISNVLDSLKEEIATTLQTSQNAKSECELSKNTLNQNNEEVKRMLAAMDEIASSSQKIESINKTIEDIAFQTNILALNAAVEAARAGAAGKGFAVVADEVRNLANKSSEAAKDTSKLIVASIEAVNNGMTLANNVAKTMQTVMDTTDKSTAEVVQIASLTQSQNESILVMKDKMAQIAQEVENNVNVANESAQIANKLGEEINNLNALIQE